MNFEFSVSRFTQSILELNRFLAAAGWPPCSATPCQEASDGAEVQVATAGAKMESRARNHAK